MYGRVAGPGWQAASVRPRRPGGLSSNDRVKKLAAAAGVPVIKLHEGRHSAASLQRDAAMGPEIAARRRATPAGDDIALHPHRGASAPGRRGGRPSSGGRGLMTADYAHFMLFTGRRDSPPGAARSASRHVCAGSRPAIESR
jgi:hypothetical protein